ncbi:NAC domain-containing protein 66-like isoform X2 [Punica granatum]|nr:NAC domain-containing protein 66-like isoform X2 [Punica granatum]
MATASKMISMKKLPVGYRLNPSDEDLVNHHLRRKLRNVLEEYCLIPEFDIYKLPPWDLITKFNELSDLASDGGDCFFYHRRNNPNGKRKNRRTDGGFWKVTGEGRKPKKTDRTKWLKRILVYHLGKQKNAEKTPWAMHEYEDTSDPSVVVCRIHKIKPKTGKQKVDSVSSEADSSSSPRATDRSEPRIEPQETSPEASVHMTMESQNQPPFSNNVPECNTSCPQQMQIDDFLQVDDLEDPQDPQVLTREQSPCSENTFIDGCDQGYVSWSYHPNVTPEEGGDKFIISRTPSGQPPNYVLPGCGSPPQHPQMMPTEEIYPLTGNTSFNARCSSETYSQSDIHGQGAEFPLVSMNCGRQEPNFKEAQQSTLNLQTPTSPPNSDLTFSPEELQMLQELLSAPSMLPSPDSSGGGDPSSLYLGQSCDSQPADLEVTQDFPIELPPSADLDSMLANFFASSPPPEVVVGKSLCGQVSTVTGGYSTEYCGVPYASGGNYKTSNHMSAGCWKL